jgi:hypothetical protein
VDGGGPGGLKGYPSSFFEKRTPLKLYNLVGAAIEKFWENFSKYLSKKMQNLGKKTN